VIKLHRACVSAISSLGYCSGTQFTGHKSMAKKKLRTITLGNERYLWRVDCRYERPDEPSEQMLARVTLIVYREGDKRSPLNVQFVTTADAHGSPLMQGGPLRLSSNEQLVHVNLHQPKYIAAIIELLREKIWPPHAAKTTVVAGFDCLMSLSMHHVDADACPLKVPYLFGTNASLHEHLLLDASALADSKND
jgi:hypothetical protein